MKARMPTRTGEPVRGNRDWAAGLVAAGAGASWRKLREVVDYFGMGKSFCRFGLRGGREILCRKRADHRDANGGVRFEGLGGHGDEGAAADPNWGTGPRQPRLGGGPGGGGRWGANLGG